MAAVNRPVYATQPRPLRDQLSRLLRSRTEQPAGEQVTAVVVPDTNLLDAGDAAASVYRLLDGRAYDTVILVSCSHSGGFGRISICNLDTYRTALGDLKVNDQIRDELCDEDDDIFVDDRGHFHTEGIEVQLPFLQMVLRGSFDIVPVVMGEESPEFCRELGAAIAEVAYNRRLLLVASADIAKADDAGLASCRDYLERGDIGRLMALLNSESVRIEGKGPLLVALIAGQQCGADRVRVVTLEPPREGVPGFLGAVIGRD